MIETKHLVEFMKHRADEHSEKMYTEDAYQEYCSEIVARLKERDTLLKCPEKSPKLKRYGLLLNEKGNTEGVLYLKKEK